MSKIQVVREGGLVRVCGFEFTVHNVMVEDELVVFTGCCTDAECNDSIRHTGYNGGRYGGNRLVYSW